MNTYHHSRGVYDARGLTPCGAAQAARSGSVHRLAYELTIRERWASDHSILLIKIDTMR
jgi:hypothetical protein